MDDAALYRAWASGDRSAGAALIDRYLVGMSRFFANKAARPSEIDDLVATTFERCARSLGTLRDPSRFRSYLFGIAANVMRDAVRKKRPEPGGSLLEIAIADLGPSPSVVAARREQERVLLEALRAIPFELQLVLELSLFEDMSRSEIADALELPEGTVASRLRRARERLAEAVEQVGATPQLRRSTVERIEDWAAGIRDAMTRRAG